MEKERDKIEQDAERDANEDTGGKRKVKRDAVALEKKVAGQFTKPSESQSPAGQPAKDGDEGSQDHQRNSQDNQELADATPLGHGSPHEQLRDLHGIRRGSLSEIVCDDP
jgi:hypothetical protein